MAIAFAAATALADADPWLVAAPPGVIFIKVMEKSERSYNIVPTDKRWAGADGPARADLPLTKDEKDAVAACRALLAKPDAEAALKAADALVAKNPSNWDAHLLRATALHARAADADALAALRESLIGNRRSPEAWKLLDDVAKALGRAAKRPSLQIGGWVRELPKDATEVGSLFTETSGLSWSYYAAARAVYRHEKSYLPGEAGARSFAEDFPEAKEYAFTFREQMFAASVLADAVAGDVKDAQIKVTADLKRILAEKKAGTLVPFAFFALYPEPVGATPERGFAELKPRLVAYFDEKIVAKR